MPRVVDQIWHFIICSALEDAAPQPPESTPHPRKGIFCSSQLLVLLGELTGALSALRLWTVSRPEEMTSLWLVCQCASSKDAHGALVDNGCQNRLQERNRCYRGANVPVTHWMTLSFDINQIQMNLSMSRHDIQQFCIKVLTVKLII